MWTRKVSSVFSMVEDENFPSRCIAPPTHTLTHVIAQYECRRFGCTLYEKIQKWISSHLGDVQNQCEVTECTNDPERMVVANEKKFNQSISTGSNKPTNKN